MDLNQGLVDLVAVALVAALAPLVVAVLPGPRIPQVVILLIGGVLIGPHVLGLAETSNIQLLANIGLGFLFLLAGYELDPQLLRRRPGKLAILMGIWQVTALGDGAREPYGQIAGPCPARFTFLAIQVRDTSTKMDGIWLVRLVPGTRSAHQGMTPRVRSGSRQRPAAQVTRA